MSLGHWILFVTYATISTAALLLMKSALTSPSFHLQIHPTLSISLSYRLMLGLFLYVTSFLTWLTIIRSASVVMAYPLSVGLVQLFLILGSRFFLASRLTGFTILGSLFIVAGIVLLSMGNA